MNLGVDFGSTYTILSTYRPDQTRLEAIGADSGDNNVDVPSVVSMRADRTREVIRYGTSAKEQGRRKGVKIYKAFKMLLTEKNLEFVESRDYQGDHTPRWVATQFLENVITTARNRCGAQEIENLVVGAPDIWFHKFDSLSGRALVRDICRDIEGVKGENVRIVSEPVLASAYFAYNYMRKRQKPYEGCILIIDYGGGTLDLSLTRVSRGKNQDMVIKILESNGAGENTDHSIGNAGIVYMESLIEHVIRKNTPELAEDIIGTPAFYDMVNQLERELRTESENIATDFKDIGTEEWDELEETPMGEPIEWGDKSYQVTLADLLRVYNETIRDVFDQKMDEMIRWAIEEHGIDALNPFGEHFRIALVGGFSNFYLVRQQMQRKFNFSAEHMVNVVKDIIDTEADCERAISYGAALIAAGIVGISSTAPYSMGIRYEERGTGVNRVNYMVRCKEDIDVNVPKYLKDSSGNNKIICLAEDKLDDFIIDYGKHEKGKIKMGVNEAFMSQLSGLVKNKYQTCGIGVSFSESDVLSLHIKECFMDSMPPRWADSEEVKELGRFENIFYEKEGEIEDD